MHNSLVHSGLIRDAVRASVGVLLLVAGMLKAYDVPTRSFFGEDWLDSR